MKYFDKKTLREISEADVDLAHGYLEPKTKVMIPRQKEVSHIEEKKITSTFSIKTKVIDVPEVPAHEETTEMWYIFTGENAEEKKQKREAEIDKLLNAAKPFRIKNILQTIPNTWMTIFSTKLDKGAYKLITNVSDNEIYINGELQNDSDNVLVLEPAAVSVRVRSEDAMICKAELIRM